MEHCVLRTQDSITSCEAVMIQSGIISGNNLCVTQVQRAAVDLQNFQVPEMHPLCRQRPFDGRRDVHTGCVRLARTGNSAHGRS
eukprot:332763-Chlamydomonas_euryale.AAC.7